MGQQWSLKIKVFLIYLNDHLEMPQNWQFGEERYLFWRMNMMPWIFIYPLSIVWSESTVGSHHSSHNELDTAYEWPPENIIIKLTILWILSVYNWLSLHLCLYTVQFVESNTYYLTAFSSPFSH